MLVKMERYWIKSGELANGVNVMGKGKSNQGSCLGFSLGKHLGKR